MRSSSTYFLNFFSLSSGITICMSMKKGEALSGLPSKLPYSFDAPLRILYTHPLLRILPANHAFHARAAISL
jgi:hypothetical protein